MSLFDNLAGGPAEPGGMERLGRRLVAINRFGSGVSAASKSWAAGQHVQYPPQARWGTHVLGCVPNVQCASRVPGLGLVRCLIDLLDFREVQVANCAGEEARHTGAAASCC